MGPKENIPRPSRLIAHVEAYRGHDGEPVSDMVGGRIAAEAALAQINPIAYGDSRNYLDGAVTRLSPYIRHGILSLNEVRNHALQMGDGKAVEKFIQSLAGVIFGSAFMRKTRIGCGLILKIIKLALWLPIMPMNCPMILPLAKLKARR